jgi:two-component system, LytTR family, response regulator
MQDHPLIRTIIIDDEKNAIMLLGEMLKRFDDVVLAGFADNVDDGLNLILTFRPHIVFLDIKLHEENGFELITRLKDFDINPVFVMVTGYNQFGLEALKAGAFDYLLKPVDPNELLRVISRLRLKQSLSHNSFPEKKIRFNTQGGFILVNPDEILYCKADANYTDIYLINNHKYTISLNIGSIERILTPPAFFRISRSVIINIKYLTEINRGKKICLLTAATENVTLHIAFDRIKQLESILTP